MPNSDSITSSSVSTATITTLADVNTTITIITSTTLTLPTTSTTSPTSGSAKGFFQNTGAVVGTFTAVGVVLLALLTFFATCLIRRRRQVIFEREAFAEAATESEPALLDNKHNSPHEGGIARMYSDTSLSETYVLQSSATTSMEGFEESASGVAGVGARHVARLDGAYSRQGQVSTNDVHVQSQQDFRHNARANPIPTSFRSPFYSSTPKQSTRTSQEARARGRGHGSYSKLLRAAGLDPGSRSSHLAAGSGSGSGGFQRGMSLSHEHKHYVFPDTYEAQQSSPPQVLAAERQGGTGAAAGTDDAYGGYVEEHERVD